MPTAPFITKCTAQTASPIFELLLNGISTNYMPYVISISQIKRDSYLSSGELQVTVDVNAMGAVLDVKQLMNIYISLAWTCELKFGFPDDVERLTLFKGFFNSARFYDGDKKCELTFRTAIDIFLANTIGYGDTPVEYDNPADAIASTTAWDILTTYANLDDTDSPANVDIDHDWFDTWAGLMLNGGAALDPYILQAEWTGESVRNALLKLCDLTESIIFTRLNGKLSFSIASGWQAGQAYTDSNMFDKASVEINHDDRLSLAHCFYGYNTTDGTWAGGIGEYSVCNKFDLTYRVNAELYEEDISMWHKNEDSAHRFATETIARLGLPTRQIRFTTGLTGFIEEIGNQIQVYDLAVDPETPATCVIEEITLNIDTCQVEILARWDW